MAEEEDDWSFTPEESPVKFDSGEHADIPSECYLKFSAADNAPTFSGKAETKESILWTVETPNPMTKTIYKVPLTFVKCIALAGDCYVYEEPKGEYDKPITYAKDFETRKARVREGVLNMKQDEGNLMPPHIRSTADGFLFINTVEGMEIPGLKSYLEREMSMVEKYLDEVPKVDDKEPEKKGAHNITLTWRDYARCYIKRLSKGAH